MGKIPIVPVTFIIDSYHSDEEIDGSRSGIRTYSHSTCRHVRSTYHTSTCKADSPGRLLLPV